MDVKQIIEDHRHWLRGEGGSRADLGSADLRNADLRNAKLPYFQIPQEGGLVVFKKTTAGVVKLLVPPTAKRTASLVGRKCRAEFAQVVSAPEGARSCNDSRTQYVEGDWVYPDSYDPDIRVECTNGIHFFLTEEEAKNY